MSIGQLSTVPSTPEEFMWLSSANQDEHYKAVLAIAASSKYGNQNLLLRPLDPIPFDDPQELETWLSNHYDSHNLINGVLGVNGSDLSSVDFRDPEQFAAWSLLHFSDHQAWQQILGTT